MLIVQGDGADDSVVIGDEELVVGRRPESDFVLSDPHVSLTHARITRSKGAILLEDLGSTNGTFVNEDPVQGSVALRHGDVVRFGVVDTRFEDRASQLGRDDRTEVMEAVEPEDHIERPVLSPRQNEVLGFLKQGLTNPQIAAKLGVTERTVKAHCQEVYDRLAVPNRTAAVDAAHRLGLPVEAPSHS
jgi:pSer/pThr/pTyr-binding forkhead associated (FHA) protein